MTKLNPVAFDRAMAERGVTCTELCETKHLSSATIARIRRGDPVSARVTTKLAEFFDETPVLPSLRELIA